MTALVWSRRARKDFDALDRTIRDRVRTGIERLAEGEGDVRRLSGYSPPLFRLRVGDLRILFRHESGTLVILRILPREKAYKS